MSAARAHASRVLVRDCPAILVPSGERAMLCAGDAVGILQLRGGAVTVRTRSGVLARIGSDHFDALGLDSPAATAPAHEGSGPPEVDDVLDRLRGIFDPEIPINVVDLGLIYRVDVQPRADGGHRVEVDMSMTAPGCGMGDVLREEARQSVEGIPGVSEAVVDLVWDPPWTIHRITEAARLELGLL